MNIIGIIGLNSFGKSTFIRMLTKEVDQAVHKKTKAETVNPNKIILLVLF